MTRRLCSRDVVLETAVLEFCGLVLEGCQSPMFSRPINNLLAFMRREIIILFAQLNNKDGVSVPRLHYRRHR